LLDLGRKKIFPPKALDPLMSKRKAAERACLSEGTRFMGGYAVPDDCIEALIPKLDEIQDMFYSEMHKFLADFEQNKAAWMNDEENKEFAHIFRDQVPDRETVANSFEFSYKLFKLQPLEGFEPDEDEIANQILHEIGQSCKAMSDAMLKRNKAISGKTLSEQLAPVIQKLDTLSFGNGRILKVLNEFFALQKSIPMELIDHNHPTFGQTLTFLSMCADSDKLESIIEGEFSITTLINSMKREALLESISSVPSRVMHHSTQLAVSKPSFSAGAYF
jgi:hypothetical protein